VETAARPHDRSRRGEPHSLDEVTQRGYRVLQAGVAVRFADVDVEEQALERDGIVAVTDGRVVLVAVLARALLSLALGRHGDIDVTRLRLLEQPVDDVDGFIQVAARTSAPTELVEARLQIGAVDVDERLVVLRPS